MILKSQLGKNMYVQFLSFLYCGWQEFFHKGSFFDVIATPRIALKLTNYGFPQAFYTDNNKGGESFWNTKSLLFVNIRPSQEKLIARNSDNDQLYLSNSCQLIRE